jgi:hypothetical protein
LNPEDRPVDRCQFKTGIQQTAAIRLCTQYGYQRIPNYGPYQGMPNSACFRKALTKKEAEE